MEQACPEVNVEPFQPCSDDLFVWNLVACVAMVIVLGLSGAEESIWVSEMWHYVVWAGDYLQNGAKACDLCGD